MTPLIEKYITSGKIEQISREKNFDKTAYNEYIRFLDYILEQDDRLGYDELDHEENVLKFLSEYIDEFIREIKKGFSVAWAKDYAYIKFYEENLNPPSMAYYASHKISHQQASQDLALYCQLNQKDNLFYFHFERCIQRDSPNAKPSAELQAETYSKIFKEQIAKGKTAVFADKYADLIAEEEYIEMACYAEAMEYEQAIKKGFSEQYASVFADKMSDYIANYFSTYEQSIGNPLVEEQRVKIEKEIENLK